MDVNVRSSSWQSSSARSGSWRAVWIVSSATSSAAVPITSGKPAASKLRPYAIRCSDTRETRSGRLSSAFEARLRYSFMVE